MSRHLQTSGIPHQRWQDRALATAAGCAAGALLLLAPDARAAIDCSVSGPGLVFGNYDVTATTAVDIAGDLNVTCTRAIGDPRNVSYALALSRGSSGSYAPRQMASGTARLNYNLFRDSARSQVWGDGSSSTSVVSSSLNFSNFQFSRSATQRIYGRIPAGQDVAAGSYSDSIVVTITF